MLKSLLLFILISLFLNPVFSQTYQYYFGNIHAHSSYSDGNKDSGTTGSKLPGDSYSYARQSYNFNFLGISEHNHLEAGMKLADYKKGLYQADTANRNGEFVCMYGMEYGVISNGGHVIIYGIDSLIGWENGNYNIYSPEYNYSSLWKIIAAKPNAFATLAHPETSDYNNLSTSTYNDTADAAIVGSAVRSGGAFSETKDYSDGPPSTTYTGFFRRMLATGYKIGPTLDHDNHYTTFGRTAPSRTVVLAQALNRDSIIAAYKAMRFYASDDWNAKVNFTINAYPLGSSIKTSVDPTINISVTDPDSGDNVSSIKLYFGVPGSGALSTVLSSVTNNAVLSYVHTILPGASYYYYAEITQADGDKIWTAPIWVQKELSILPIENIVLTGVKKQQSISLKAILTKTNYTEILLEKSFKGNDFSTIENLKNVTETNLSFVDNNPAYGAQYYRLKCIGKNGEVSYSPVALIYFNDDRIMIVKATPNPARSMVNLNIKSSINSKASIKIFDAQGLLQQVFQQNLIEGTNNISYNIESFKSGRYTIVIEAAGAKAETSIIKL